MLIVGNENPLIWRSIAAPSWGSCKETIACIWHSNRCFSWINYFLMQTDLNTNYCCLIIWLNFEAILSDWVSYGGLITLLLQEYHLGLLTLCMELMNMKARQVCVHLLPIWAELLDVMFSLLQSKSHFLLWWRVKFVWVCQPFHFMMRFVDIHDWSFSELLHDCDWSSFWLIASSTA